MAAEIDAAQVRHIAKLARLNLSAEEVGLFARQLGSILEYVRQLESVNTEGVEPMVHALPVTNVLRDDEPQPSFEADRALANAPQREGSFFRVPAVLDQSAGA